MSTLLSAQDPVDAFLREIIEQLPVYENNSNEIYHEILEYDPNPNCDPIFEDYNSYVEYL